MVDLIDAARRAGAQAFTRQRPRTTPNYHVLEHIKDTAELTPWEFEATIVDEYELIEAWRDGWDSAEARKRHNTTIFEIDNYADSDD